MECNNYNYYLHNYVHYDLVIIVIVIIKNKKKLIYCLLIIAYLPILQ